MVAFEQSGCVDCPDKIVQGTLGHVQIDPVYRLCLEVHGRAATWIDVHARVDKAGSSWGRIFPMAEC